MFEKEIVKIYEETNMCFYPIDPFWIMRTKGYTLIRYSDLKYQYGEEPEFISQKFNDAVTDMDARVVLYNDRRNYRRVRFTLMHELGHIVIGDNEDEDGADAFAAEILAPLAVIRHKKMKTAKEVSDFFNVSMMAANQAIYRAYNTSDENDNIILDYFRYTYRNNVMPSAQLLYEARFMLYGR